MGQGGDGRPGRGEGGGGRRALLIGGLLWKARARQAIMCLSFLISK